MEDSVDQPNSGTNSDRFLTDVPDECGCVGVWEFLSEYRENGMD